MPERDDEIEIDLSGHPRCEWGDRMEYGEPAPCGDAASTAREGMWVCSTHAGDYDLMIRRAQAAAANDLEDS